MLGTKLVGCEQVFDDKWMNEVGGTDCVRIGEFKDDQDVIAKHQQVFILPLMHVIAHALVGTSMILTHAAITNRRKRNLQLLRPP